MTLTPIYSLRRTTPARFELDDPVYVMDIIADYVERRTGRIVGRTIQRETRYDVRLDVDGEILYSLPANRVRAMETAPVVMESGDD